MKMYLPGWSRGMTFAALLMAFTAGTAIAQDTITLKGAPTLRDGLRITGAKPGGGQAIRFTPAK